MTKERRTLMEWYLEELKGEWVEDLKSYCDLCRRVPRLKIEWWAQNRDPPYFCQDHARELGLKW